ncbi:hypothetical protein E2C01_101944 [Portunus trituberculatus]|uniref:Uncharacterized protein n=1 Tax=Portunus trituberculatus TaxID=210409 RepID=A0A5B7KBW9_PORTR|nr:hypothetical protein [Portunus trituberculatus]
MIGLAGEARVTRYSVTFLSLLVTFNHRCVTHATLELRGKALRGPVMPPHRLYCRQKFNHPPPDSR